MVHYLWVSMRPKQWIKNLLLFAPLIFSQNVFHPMMLLKSMEAFAIFCFLSSGVYLLNDLLDREKDQKHPLKSYRPLASGKIGPSPVKLACAFLLILSLLASLMIHRAFAAVCLGYVLLQIIYSVYFKEIVILDVFSIAAGFFLRVVAGAKAIDVPLSSWLLICTLFLSLFLALGKRRHEVLFLGEKAGDHRGVLNEYNIPLLDQMVGIAAAGTVISYALYTLSSETIKKFQTENLWVTIPIVLHGVFRYLYRVYRKDQGGYPELIFFEDRALQVTVLLYALVVVMVIYF